MLYYIMWKGNKPVRYLGTHAQVNRKQLVNNGDRALYLGISNGCLCCQRLLTWLLRAGKMDNTEKRNLRIALDKARLLCTLTAL